MKTVILHLIGIYQRFIGPFLGPHCRFHPSCSEFAREAIVVHGAARGSWLTVGRLLRCQPFSPGGLDPVPGIDRRKAAI